jgi:hypothetical protein
MGTLAQNSINLLPNSVFEAAKAGDTEAVELILKHYSRYINKLCCRKLYSENGFSCVCLDAHICDCYELIILLRDWSGLPFLRFFPLTKILNLEKESY